MLCNFSLWVWFSLICNLLMYAVTNIVAFYKMNDFMLPTYGCYQHRITNLELRVILAVEVALLDATKGWVTIAVESALLGVLVQFQRERTSKLVEPNHYS